MRFTTPLICGIIYRNINGTLGDARISAVTIGYPGGSRIFVEKNVIKEAPEYTAAVEGGGTLPVNIDTGLKRATVSASEQQGNIIAGGGTVVIDLPSIPGVNSYTLTVRADSLSARADSLSDRTGKGTLTLNTDAGRLTLPANMLTGISAASGKQAEITIGQADASALPDNIKTAVGDRPLIQLTLSLDGKQTGWSNPDAPVTVSIPYVPTAEELANPESIVIWYIDGSGKAVSVPIISARDVTDGTGGGNFSPNAKLTRGQFIVMLMKAYQIGPDTAGAGSSMAEAADNFADAGNTWYTGYLAAAKRLGISTGAGNNLFAPDREITRQEMFTLLYNGLKAVGELPHGSGGKKLSGFSDAEQIAPWAAEAMSLMAETGTIAGSGGKLSPAGTATRAEMAQVLYHLLSQ